jgi:hypothetical protein
VTAASERAGLTPAAIRQRRHRDQAFRAAEKAVREGGKYLPPESTQAPPQPEPDPLHHYFETTPY